MIPVNIVSYSKKKQRLYNWVVVHIWIHLNRVQINSPNIDLRSARAHMTKLAT